LLQVNNHTPFAVQLTPALDQHGQNYAVLVIKGTFEIRPRTQVLVIADEQLPPMQKDVFYGEPGKTSLRYEADVAWIKPAVDVVLNGHAYPPNQRPASAIDAGLQVGGRTHVVRVFGDRHWEKVGLRWQPSSPARFERMPLSYEHAYGGSFPADDRLPGDRCAENPVGKGFIGAQGQGLEEGAALPNVECPQTLIREWDDRPKPVGFGFVARDWQPRLGYAGTYDKQWKHTRMPLLPGDFDKRFNNSAHPDLTFPEGLPNEARIALHNLSESGTLSFSLPGYQFRVSALIKSSQVESSVRMDTVLIEPDDNRVLITWRAAIPCAQQFLYVDRVSVDWRPA
jgi:hypothetical protein